MTNAQNRRLSAGELRSALDALGWSQQDAADALGVCNQQRMSDWCCGKRRVPRYVSSNVRTHLLLAECREGK